MSAASEFYKIFAYKADGYWRGNQLLPVSQIRCLLAALQWKHECFATIQSYDKEGTCLSSPFFFDLDGTPDKVLADARHLVASLEFLANVTPRIYFSGNRGFHFTIDYVVEHPRCHLLVQAFAREVGAGLTTIDHKVYRTYSMFRIPGSIGSDPQFYKIELTRDELMTLSFDQIRELARTQRMIDSGHTTETIDQWQISEWLKLTLAELPRYDTVAKFAERHPDLEQDFTPCLRTMLAEGVDRGRRNEAVFILAKFFKAAGMDIDSAAEMFLANEAWQAFEKEGREVTKVLRSVFKGTATPRIGCRGESSNAELMRAYCSNRCFLAPDFVEIDAS